MAPAKKKTTTSKKNTKKAKTSATKKSTGAKTSKKASAKKKAATKTTTKKTTSSKKSTTSKKKKVTKSASAKKAETKTSAKKTKATSKKTATKKTPAKKAKSTASKKKSTSKRKLTRADKIRESKGSPKRLNQRIKEEVTQETQMILAPTEKMLKPFRDAAKRNQKMMKDKKKRSKRSSFLAKPPRSGKKCSLDLRVHSPASEGYFSTGGIDPAAAMVRLAKAKGLDMLAVTDYHTGEFVDKVKEHARETSVTILPGLDLRCQISTCDEVSLVALFPEQFGTDELEAIVKELEVPRSARGSRTYSIQKDVQEVIKIVEEHGGALIPSRLDKTPSRQVALQDLVEKFGFHVFDLVHPDNPEYFKNRWPSGEFTFLSFSNANALGQIGTRAVTLKLGTKGFEGLKTFISRRSENSEQN